MSWGGGTSEKRARFTRRCLLRASSTFFTGLLNELEENRRARACILSCLMVWMEEECEGKEKGVDQRRVLLRIAVSRTLALLKPRRSHSQSSEPMKGQERDSDSFRNCHGTKWHCKERIWEREGRRVSPKFCSSLPQTKHTATNLSFRLAEHGSLNSYKT